MEKKIHIGIQLLRTIFSFNIIVYHCLKRNHLNKIIYFLCLKGVPFYVPTFFFLSSYFSYKTFSSDNIIKFKERLLRLSIPYIIWPCLFWFRQNCINYFKGIKDKYIYKKLIYQLLIGKPINPVFWFQFCLLFWSIFMIIIILIFKRIYNSIFALIFIVILSLNYFGFIHELLKNNKGNLSRSIKELSITIIYILSGFFFGSKNLLELDRYKKLKIACFSIYIFFVFQRSLNINRHSYLRQLVVNIIFIIFSFLHFDFIKNKKLLFLIKQMTSYSAGIYYIHWDINFRVLNHFLLIKQGNFASCIIIYLFCFIFCYFNCRIFKKTKIRYLFQ